jgi:hypothetical protein
VRGEVNSLILNDFNQSTLDPVGPVNQGMAVLNEMNNLDAGHDQFTKSLASRLQAM